MQVTHLTLRKWISLLAGSPTISPSLAKRGRVGEGAHAYLQRVLDPWHDAEVFSDEYLQGDGLTHRRSCPLHRDR
jgi:hypothetical protein